MTGPVIGPSSQRWQPILAMWNLSCSEGKYVLPCKNHIEIKLYTFVTDRKAIWIFLSKFLLDTIICSVCMSIGDIVKKDYLIFVGI